MGCRIIAARKAGSIEADQLAHTEKWKSVRTKPRDYLGADIRRTANARRGGHSDQSSNDQTPSAQ